MSVLHNSVPSQGEAVGKLTATATGSFHKMGDFILFICICNENCNDCYKTDEVTDTYV
jgi:hypothetical protein